MLNRIKQAGLTIIAVCTIFFTVAYTSCKKPDDGNYVDECDAVVCQNGGTCFKGICTCPLGFSGDNCEEKWLSRYIGNWDVTQTILISNDLTRKGTVSNYRIAIKAKGNSTFTIDGLMGVTDYRDVVCYVGVAEDGVTNYNPGTFIFAENYALPNSRIILTRGDGEANSIGKNMNGKFFITFPKNVTADSVLLVNETITFTAEYAD